MQFVRGDPDWSALGTAIAGMQRHTDRRFGWHRDNRAGRFVQHNSWAEDWPTFFVENRVRPHLADPNVPVSLRVRIERACDGPIQATLPAHPVPSLTHGDLWQDNIVDGRWMIDPEVSFADRELDLAYMLMSTDRPLPADFWDAYQSQWPIPPDFESRRRVLGLHHRLLQVRHRNTSIEDRSTLTRTPRTAPSPCVPAVLLDQVEQQPSKAWVATVRPADVRDGIEPSVVEGSSQADASVRRRGPRSRTALLGHRWLPR